MADVAAGYLVNEDLWLGVHHVYNINNTSASDFKESRSGKIGPSMTYTGFSKEGLFVSANLNFDYYHTFISLTAIPITAWVAIFVIDLVHRLNPFDLHAQGQGGQACGIH